MKNDNPNTFEYNFDGLIGPTHNYAGLSYGNKASMHHKYQVSHPRQAALEGLKKMKFLMNRGFKQGLFPPHERPDLSFLKTLGFQGSKTQILQSAYKFSASLLPVCWSASAMWTANSATFSPSPDTEDEKAHFTPANLLSFPHRALETPQTARILKKIFSDPRHFKHHPPLPSLPALSDEGAANHNRLSRDYGQAGVELFVYGRNGFKGFAQDQSSRFYPRQSRTASQTVAFRHRLKPQKTVQAQQNPEAIDQGVFHNDVICVADQNLIFYHEEAWTNTKAVLAEIRQKLLPTPLQEIKVKSHEVSLKEAVSSYLFNSQLLPEGQDRWLLLAPLECRQNPPVWDYIQFLNQSTVIKSVHFMPLRQSMQNGGGPACLRLRVVLTEEEAKSLHQGVILTPSLYKKLKIWVQKHYRDRLSPKDLLDPLLVEEVRTALEELTKILDLGNIYPFQLE